MTGNLYIVATPIGNLKDITLRAIDILKKADLILAEDTRVTKKLLSHYGISGKEVKRADGFSERKIVEDVERFLRKGGNVVLVSDSGTPAISDPGAFLISGLRERIPELKAIPIPGPSAVTAALSASGIGADSFTFVGYPPHKKGRKKFFGNLAEIKVLPIVMFESPHRLLKSLSEMKEFFGGEREIMVARELTKIYEEFFKGSIEDALDYFNGEKQKGEFVLIIF